MKVFLDEEIHISVFGCGLCFVLFMISHLSIRLLWRLENALLHKTFLSKCFLTEVLPLPLLLLTLREERMLFVKLFSSLLLANLLLNLCPLCLLLLLLGFQVFISGCRQLLLVLHRVLRRPTLSRLLLKNTTLSFVF